MDSIDDRILHHLQRRGRIANNELADLVGLSPSTCLRRVRSLEESGVIEGYAAIVDPAAVDRSYTVLLWVTLEQVTRASLAAFEEAVADVDAIVVAYRMMGQPDYLLHIAVADLDAYERLYTDHLAGLPYVHILTSQVTMKTVKRAIALPGPR